MNESSKETPINQATYRFRPKKKGGEPRISRSIAFTEDVYRALLATARKEQRSTSSIVNEILAKSERITPAIREVANYRQLAQERLKYSSMRLFRGRKGLL